jgi:hypothetical protein
MTINEVVIKSPIASAMGARISVTGPVRGMYLVVGKSGSIDSLIKTVEGEVALRLNGGKMLVTLPFGGYLSLRSNSQVSYIGPVTVDVKRLARVTEMLAKAVPCKTG